MAQEYKIKFEYFNPTNVECEVPHQQPLRTPDNEENPTNYEEVPTRNEETSPEDGYTFVEVLTVKKEESAFTKGDMKLQKVAVTENISTNKESGGPRVFDNPIYSLVIGKTIKGPQPIRNRPTNEGSNADLNNSGEEKKSRTRIPIGKFKQTAKRMKEPKRDTVENAVEVILSQKRRSSIPRLKGSKIIPQSGNNQKHVKREEMKVKIDKETDVIRNNDTGQLTVRHDVETPQTEDEFERIYEEIVDINVDFDDKVLIDKIDDPDNLETSFEEIVHAYDENKTQSIKVDKVRSRIPLVKQRSLYDGEICKRIDRRSSLKDTVQDNNKAQDTKNKVTNNNKNKIKYTSPKAIEITEKKTEGNNKVENIEITPKDGEPLDKTFSKNTSCSEKASEDTVRVARPNFDEFIKRNQAKKDEQKDYSKNLNRRDVVELNIKPLNESLSYMPDSFKLVKSVENINEANKNESNEDVKKTPAVEQDIPEKRNSNSDVIQTERNKDGYKGIPVARGKVSNLISKIASNEKNVTITRPKDLSTTIPKKNSIMSKIAVFTGDKVHKNENKNQVKPKIPISTRKVEKIIENNADPPKKPIKDKENDLNNQVEATETSLNVPVELENEVLVVPKSVNLSEIDTTVPVSDNIYEDNSKNANNNRYEEEEEEETDTSKHMGEKDIEKDELNKTLLPEEQVTIEAYTPSVVEEKEDSNSNLEKLAGEKDNHIMIDTVNATIKPDLKIKRDEYKDVFKGKVSRIISRLDSHEERVTEIPKKEVEIPKKKSVSSRIAMFERQTSEKTTKPNWSVKGPENNLSKEYLKPKIIDEILKKPIRNTNEEDIDKDLKGASNDTLPKFIATSNSLTSDKSENSDELFEDDDRKCINIVDDTVEYTPKITEDDTLYEDTTQITNDSAELKPNLEGKENNINDNEKSISEDVARNTDNNAESTIKNDKNSTEKGVITKEIATNKNDDDYDEVFSVYNGKLVESRKIRLKSTTEESNMRRTKSYAELDLGEAVKGKVLQMIVRINSMENILVEKKEVISAKERPRKMSVSEKIALFEGKLAPVKMESPSTAANKTEQKNVWPPMYTPEELQAKIAELNNAAVTYGRMQNMVYMGLNSGKEMPVLGLGTAGAIQKCPSLMITSSQLDPRLTQHIIGAAIDLGYRAIDTAYIYGNEKAVGEAIKAKILDGAVKREDLFITSKLWSTFHRKDLVETACRASLKEMQLEYFDLYLIHNPMSLKEGGDPIPKIANVVQFSEHDYLDAWYGLEDLVSMGLVKTIGVSNFNSPQLARVIEKGRIKPAVNQVECHPYLSQQRLDDFCKGRGVKLICYGVLGSKGTPAELKNTTAAVIDDPLVQVLAAGLKITPAQLLIRYQIEKGHSVVAKASSGAHLWDNLQALRVQLDSTQVDGLSALNRNRRTYTFKGLGETHKNYPFKTPY